ncbi:LuxR C-terminal-related transcriptional regulator [Streptomyces sp. NBC_01538]|uniref:helix-turn-helix domain-containing protein n=1 Tax=Streptomyces sp. NBC_01538 TaxID=2903897 RepID=UPI0038659158
MAGGATVGPDPRPVVADPLSRREREVAALVAKGMTNRQAASVLGLSPRTADAHVVSILSKLGFSCRAQIAAWWAATRPSSPGVGN